MIKKFDWRKIVPIYQDSPYNADLQRVKRWQMAVWQGGCSRVSAMFILDICHVYVKCMLWYRYLVFVTALQSVCNGAIKPLLSIQASLYYLYKQASVYLSPFRLLLHWRLGLTDRLADRVSRGYIWQPIHHWLSMKYAKTGRYATFLYQTKNKNRIYIHILLILIQHPYLYHSIFWMNPIYYAKDIKQTNRPNQAMM